VVDQFGGPGPKHRKYTPKRFKELLLSIKDLSMEEQGKRVEEDFYSWKGNHEQLDDVMVIGVRYRKS